MLAMPEHIHKCPSRRRPQNDRRGATSGSLIPDEFFHMFSTWRTLHFFFEILLGCSILLPSIGALIHETRRPHPLWKRTTFSSRVQLQNPHPNSRFPLKFRLRQQNLHKLDQELMRISDPDSETYGKFWSPKEVQDFFAPSQETHQLVSDWLTSKDPSIGSNDITIDPLLRWIHVDTTLKQAEHVLETSYHHYSNPYGQLHIGCDSYHLPENIAQHVDIVTPTVHHPVHHLAQDKRLNRRSMRQVPYTPVEKTELEPLNPDAPTHPVDRLARCGQTTTLPCLQHMYNFTDYRPIATTKNSFAIVSFTPQYTDLNVVDDLFRLTSPYCVGARPRTHRLGKEEPKPPSEDDDTIMEVELDVEYSIPLVYPLVVDQYQVLQPSLESSLVFDPLFEALDCIYNQGNRSSRACEIKRPANVISISYGSSEVSQPLSVLMRQCSEYGKLGLMGTTVLVASGDDGVAGHLGQCADPKKGSLGPNGRRFVPDFPASCPWVTAVAATQIPEGGTWQSREEALDSQGLRNNGGFSDVFGIPDYQKKTIEAYFKAHRPPYSSDQYNNSGKTRAFPDISLNGANYLMAHNTPGGKRPLFYDIYGSSAATPVMASIIALVNDARLAIGKKPVGFINPSLYSPRFASAFNDITVGNNRGCNTTGFPAVPGWDPVTGHGTVNADKLIKLWKCI